MYWNCSGASVRFVMEDFSSFLWQSGNPKFKLSGMFCMNEGTVLVCVEQMHGECMIILKVWENVCVAWNCFCRYTEGKEEETVKCSYLHRYAEGC